MSKKLLIELSPEKENKKLPSKKSLIVFTDGSCSGNGKYGAVGGIGIHFPNGEIDDVSEPFEGACTNQRTELCAILKALRLIKENNFFKKRNQIIIYSDSQYSINCITKWADKWKENGWKTTTGSDVANQDFIKIIHKYYTKYKPYITFIHVVAHTNATDDISMANAVADRLATEGTKIANIRKKENISDTTVSKKRNNSDETITFKRKKKEIDDDIEVTFIENKKSKKKN